MRTHIELETEFVLYLGPYNLVPVVTAVAVSFHKLPIEQIPTSLNMNAMNCMFVKFVGHDRVSIGVYPPLLHRLRPPPDRQPLCYHPDRLARDDRCVWQRG